MLLSRLSPSKIKGQPTLTYVARQTGEAWTRPFVSVFEPSVSSEGNFVSRVDFVRPEGADDAAGIEVTLKDGRKDFILSATSCDKETGWGKMKARASYACLREKDGTPVRLLLGHGLLFLSEGIEVRSSEPVDVSMERKGGVWYYTASRPCEIKCGGKTKKVKATDCPAKW